MDDNVKRSHVCVDCQATSPSTDTNYTLISARYGWRLVVSSPDSATGQRKAEWRCPKCWENHKRARA